MKAVLVHIYPFSIVSIFIFNQIIFTSKKKIQIHLTLLSLCMLYSPFEATKVCVLDWRTALVMWLLESAMWVISLVWSCIMVKSSVMSCGAMSFVCVCASQCLIRASMALRCKMVCSIQDQICHLCASVKSAKQLVVMHSADVLEHCVILVSGPFEVLQTKPHFCCYSKVTFSNKTQTKSQNITMYGNVCRRQSYKCTHHRCENLCIHSD